jgi:hypothetical protein
MTATAALQPSKQAASMPEIGREHQFILRVSNRSSDLVLLASIKRPDWEVYLSPENQLAV